MAMSKVKFLLISLLFMNEKQGSLMGHYSTSSEWSLTLRNG